jgi:hypothetical protein
MLLLSSCERLDKMVRSISPEAVAVSICSCGFSSSAGVAAAVPAYLSK